MGDLQFGLKAGNSPNLCSFMLKESLAYYISGDSPVYCALLNAIKAFDRTNDSKRFKLLMERHLPANIVAEFVYLHLCARLQCVLVWLPF